MFGRYGRLVAALGGLAVILLVSSTPVSAKDQPQAPANGAQASKEPQPDGGEHARQLALESVAIDREANRIAERANLIAETQRGYAFIHLILGGVGVGFTALAAGAAIAAAIYAKSAADAARDSANADTRPYKTNFRRAFTGEHFWQRPIITEGGNEAT